MPYDLEKKRAKTRRANQKAKQKNRDYVLAYKLAHPCACGEAHPACLDFHHRDRTQKRDGISKAITSGWSLKRLIEEIAKCDLICSNCHRKLHWAEEQEKISAAA